MKHKAADLEGALLDAAVAKAEGRKFDIGKEDTSTRLCCYVRDPMFEGLNDSCAFYPSAEWFFGGPIIERERIEIAVSNRESGWWANPATGDSFHAGAWGPTPLIAAMRAFVASKLGEEVELP